MMPSQPTDTHRTHSIWSLALCATVFGVLALDARNHFILGHEALPYENWDEIAVFNNSRVLESPIRTRVYSYGTLDTAKLLLARTWIKAFYPLREDIPPINYSNNVPKSWSDPEFNFRDRAWQDLSAIDYNYFRGTPDRAAITVARYINALCALLVIATIFLVAFKRYSVSAIGIWSSLFILSTTPEWHFQAHQILPNAVNAVLAFAVVGLAFEFIITGRRLFLFTSLCCVALGINHKFDFCLFGLVPLLAAIWWAAHQLRHLSTIIHMAVSSAVVFILACVATNPYLASSPLQEIKYQLAVIATMAGGVPSISTNLHALSDFLRQSISLQPSVVVANWPTYFFLSFTVLLLVTFLLSRRIPPSIKVAIGLMLSVILLLASIPVFRASQIYTRYFLNAWGATLALVGFSLSYLITNGGSASRRLSIGMSFALCLFAGMREVGWTTLSTSCRTHHDPITNLDTRLNRNRAVITAIEAVKSRQYGSDIWVDQHGYFDLRALIDSGLTVHYINCLNYKQVFAKASGGKHLIVYALGTPEISPRYIGLWPADLRKAYDEYLSFLSALPLVANYEGNPMRLLDWRPPLPSDEIRIAAFEGAAN